MKIVIAPDSFKGTLSSLEVSDIIKKCIENIMPEAEILTVPVADGGEGSLDSFKAFADGNTVTCEARGPFGERIAAEYLLLRDGTAVIETAKAVGLTLAGDKKDPMLTTTLGVGDMIRSALDKGAKKIILTLGGSSTNDGGIGMAAALGATFLKGGKELQPIGKNLIETDAIDLTCLDKRIFDTEFIAMCDVSAVPYGKNGAAYVFSPQKGAKPGDIPILDEGMKNLTNILFHVTGNDYKNLAGGGAAGGLGLAAKAFLNAELKKGIEVVLDLADFDNLIRDADFVITGEGKLDTQSLMGKVIFGISRRTKNADVPLIVLCGLNELTPQEIKAGGIVAVFESNKKRLPFEQIKGSAKCDLMAAAYEACLFIKKLK